MGNTRLELSRNEMREMGYWIVDLVVNHLASLAELPPSRQASPEALRPRLVEPIPRQGVGWRRAVDRFERDVLPATMFPAHPRFFAFVPSPGNFVSAMGQALASGLNLFSGIWAEGAGPTQIELVVLDWFRELLGLPSGTEGLLVSGGSMANLTALAVARRVKLGNRLEGAVGYCSDQTHSSVQRALAALGFSPEQLVQLESDERFRLDPEALRRRVRADRAKGRRPFCVVANAGTTNTGAIDPLDELARICREEDLWLHADGAYGAAAALCPSGRALLRGLDQVDSLALDPHKWLFQPYGTGCVLVRDGKALEETFRVLPEYLRDVAAQEGEVNFCDRGIELTRPFRALGLWLSLQVFGLDAFVEAVERGFHQARRLEQALRDRGFEIVTAAQLGVVTFRWVRADASPSALDAFQRELAARLADDGFAFVHTTELRGRTVLRACCINPRTTDQDLEQAAERLRALAGRSAPEKRLSGTR